VDDDVDRVLAEHGRTLASAIVEVVPGWVVRSVLRHGGPLAEATSAGAAAAAELAPRLEALLTADVDAQRTNPLALVRDAVVHPTRVLRAAGIEPPARSRFDQEHFPDDPYGLVPMTWRDVDESLHELGLVWGALKARAHKDRHA
jgi:hypothetical protein